MKISVKVHAGCRQEKIFFSSDINFVEIWTRAKAHDNEANEKVVEIIAKYFRVSKSDVKIVNGARNKNKIIEINTIR